MIKRVQNGILNGKREKNQENEEKVLIFSFLKKGKMERKYRKSELIIRFLYYFLENSLIFSLFLLISYRFPILKKKRKKGKKNVVFEYKNIELCQIYLYFKEKCPFLSILSLFSGSRCVFPCLFCIVFLCLKRRRKEKGNSKAKVLECTFAQICILKTNDEN